MGEVLGQIACGTRHGKEGPFRSCLRVYEFKSGEDREIVCDDGDKEEASDRFTWSSVQFAPDNEFDSRTSIVLIR